MLKFGVCLGVDVEKIRILKDLGYDYFEVHIGELGALSQNEFESFNESIKKIGLACKCANCFIPSDLKVVGENIAYDALHLYIEKAFLRLRELGVSTVVFGSSSARKIPEGFERTKAFDQVVHFLSKIVTPLAKEYGISVAIEPLNKKECSWINNLNYGKKIVDAVGQESIKLIADLYHMEAEGEGAEDLRVYNSDIIHAHVACPELRTCPHPNDKYDYGPFLIGLEAIGCERCSIEARFKDFKTEVALSLNFLKQSTRFTNR